MNDLTVIVNAARLLADPLRLRILRQLEKGRLSVSEIVMQLNTSQPRVSAQLALLREAGWVDVITYGRQRYYQLASPQIHVVIQELAATPTTEGEDEIEMPEEDLSTVTSDVRIARTCYDHLAGTVGVQVYNHLLLQEWLVPTNEGVGKYQPALALTPKGEVAFAQRGIPIPAIDSGRRRFAFACPDWTEGHPHLGGALGVALFQHMERSGLVKRQNGTRAVLVADTLLEWLTG